MYFKLFNSCKIVLGAKYSIIIDVQRGFYNSIPNSLFSIIKDLEDKTIEEIKNEIEEESKEIFHSYIDFLINNDFGFMTSKPDEFVYFELKKLKKPSNNFIIVFSSDIDDNIVQQLNQMDIDALHINSYTKINFENIKLFLEQIIKITSIRFVSVLLIYDNNIKENDLLDLGFIFPIVGQIFIHSSPFEKNIKSKFLNLHYITNNSISEKNCGIINSSYFSCNTSMYNESKCFNSCLAGKMTLDINGNIKNCPSMPQSFGNIKDTTLEEAINHKEFKKYWNLTKDKIEVCKDCEFRYICTDCRAYTEQTHTNKNGLDISKPLKCGYDPYTGEWEEWSTNPLKQKAIQFYGMEDLIKKN